MDADKWAFVFVYRPPKMSNNDAIEHLELILNRVFVKYKYVLISGDLNFNLLDPKGTGKPLVDMMDRFDLKNIVKEPTCFKVHPPTLNDVFITNAPNLFFRTNARETGISDFHKMVTTVRKGAIPNVKPSYVKYRCHKNFVKEDFNRDVSLIPYFVTPFGDVDENYWLQEVVDEHLPPKTKRLKKKPAVFMNSTWRKAINRRNRLKNVYYSNRSKKNWENYRKQRNLCTSLRRKSVQNYLTVMSRTLWMTFRTIPVSWLSRKIFQKFLKLLISKRHAQLISRDALTI